MKKAILWSVLAVVFGSLLYGALYFKTGHSEAFKFAEQQIRASPEIQAKVGNIVEVRPSLLGPYDQQHVNSDEWVSMRVDVVGTSGRVGISVKVNRKNGVWTVESLKDDS